MAPPNADELVSQFVALTQASPEVATNHLGAANWDLEAAVQEFFTSQEEDEAEENNEEGNEEDLPAVPGGGRTLGGEGVPSRRVPAAGGGAASSSNNGGGGGGGGTQQKKKFGSLRDLAGSRPAPPSNSDDDDDDDPDLYAGGEKSGLAVQNPDDIRRKIVEKARRQAAAGGLPDDDGASAQRSHFTGRAQTLGGDDAPSRVIEDPSANQPQPLARVQRTLHFWENGFSVDDGPLYHKDDPANAARLEMIQRGHAPYEILNVAYDQEADVKLEQHDGPYVQPKKKYVPFSGAGQRLGSPTPAASGVAPPPAAVAAASSAISASSASASTSAPAPTVDVDPSQPTVRIQIRLADGSRLISSFNTTHTIGDVYSFVTASNAASQTRSWVLATTFPNKELEDKALAIADSPELKKGGAIVQKWK